MFDAIVCLFNFLINEIIEHKMFFSIIGIIIYFIGILIEVSISTITNVKFHEGGFLNMGYTTHDNKETTPKDVRSALLWPIKFILFIIKTPIFFLNEDIIPILLLIFGFKYKNTKIYKFIEKYT